MATRQVERHTAVLRRVAPPGRGVEQLAAAAAPFPQVGNEGAAAAARPPRRASPTAWERRHEDTASASRRGPLWRRL